MDSVDIISRERSNYERDLHELLATCCTMKLSFATRFVSFKEEPDVIITTYEPFRDEFGEETQPMIRASIYPDDKRENVHNQFPAGYESYYWITGLRCREKEFMLPLIIALLERNPVWRLYNVEGVVLDISRLQKALQEDDRTWAYISEQTS